MASADRFVCEVCGSSVRGMPKICRYCHSAICRGCMDDQAGVGHLEAEHRHEMAQESGDYRRGDEDDWQDRWWA